MLVKMFCMQEDNWLDGYPFVYHTLNTNKGPKKFKGQEHSFDLEFVVKGGLPGEMPKSWPEQALLTQAILLRAFILWVIRVGKYKDYPFDITDTSDFDFAFHMSKMHNITDNAADATKDMVIDVDCPEWSRSNRGVYSWNGITKNDPYTWAYMTQFPDENTSGHGRGMSQTGVYIMANQGKHFTKIIEFYYDGAQIRYINEKGEIMFVKLQRGAKGDDVKDWQGYLGGLKTDGDFGPKTEARVKEWQEEHGLIKSGIIDKRMYNIRYPDKQLKYKIALDDGHGMTTTGGKWTPPLEEDMYINGLLVRAAGLRIKENEYNDAVMDVAEARLAELGFEVFRSAPGDDDPPLSKRRADIKAAQCDFCLSQHYNASNSNDVWDNGNGISAKIDDDTPSEFAWQFAEKAAHLISTLFDQRLRGIDKADLAMTNENALGCPACLMENGFMTNKTEAAYMLDPEVHILTAEAYVRVLCEMFGVEYAVDEEPGGEAPEDLGDPEFEATPWLSKKIGEAKAILDEITTMFDL